MNKFWQWFAVSPIAQAGSVAAVAALTWVGSNIGQFNLHPVLMVAIIAGLPVIIDALNPEDARFGKVDEELFEDN
jgi:hypothetical protein